MAKQSLLLVDADPKSARMLEVSLRKAGYSVTHAEDADIAFSHADLSPPDLILSDTELPGVDGFQLLQRLRAHPTLRDVPFMFLSGDTNLESKRRGLELGVEYLTKPAYLREVITRVALELQRHERKVVEQGSGWSSHMAGSLAEMGVVDLLQLVERGEKSGVLHIHSGTDRVDIYFTEGCVVDAAFERESGPPKVGAEVVYRAMTWSEGLFDLEFAAVERTPTVQEPMQQLLMEGMRRLDEYERLLEQLPPLDSVFEVDGVALADRLAELPDRINEVLRHFNARHSLQEVVDASGWEDFEALETISKLYFEGMIVPASEPEPRRPTENEAPEQGRASLKSDQVGRQPMPTEAPPEGPLGVLGANAAGMEQAPSSASETVAGVTSPEHGSAVEDQPDQPASGKRSGRGRKRKGKRRQKARVKQRSVEEPKKSNVIQFPGKGAVAYSAGHVAVNDDVAVNPSAEPVPADLADGAGDNAGNTGRDREAGKHVAPSEGVPEEQDGATAETPEARSTEAPASDAEDAGSSSAPEQAQSVEAAPESATEESADSAEPGTAQADAGQDDSLVEGRAASKSNEDETGSKESDLEEQGEPPEAMEAEGRVDSEQGEAAREGGEARDPSSSSADAIRAIADSGEHPQLEQFFSKQPEHAADDNWDDLEPMTAASESNQHMKLVALSILGVAAVVFGGFGIYQAFFAIQPDPDVGGHTLVELPPPLPPMEPLEPETESLRAPENDPVTTDTVASMPETDPLESELPTEAERSTELAEAPEDSASEEEEPLETGQDLAASEQSAVETTASPGSAALAAPPPGYSEKIAEANALRGRAAEAAYREAYELYPDGVEALAALAFIDLEARRYEAAVEKAQRAVDRDPTSSKAWVVLGASYQGLRDQSRAQEAYRACVDQGVGRYVRDCRQMVR